MLTRHFQHLWHWWQCLSVSDISDGKSQEWVRQIRLTHYIFPWDKWQTIHWFTCINQRLWVYGSFTPDFVTDICLNSLILREPLCLQCVHCELRKYAWHYSAGVSVTARPLYSITGYLFLSSHTILFDLQHSWTPKWPVTFVPSTDNNDFPYGS